MKIILIVAIAALFLQSCPPKNNRLQISSSIPYYSVTISDENIRQVQVDASLPLSEDTLWMSQAAFSPLTNGYATFVDDLKATDDNGNSISLTSVGAGVWKVDAPVHSTIHLKYNVAIGHDTVPWSVSSAFARAYSVDNILFFTGRTIFISPKGADSAKIQVQFTLPPGWEIATPYSNLDNNSNTYQASNLTDLWDNGNFAGRFVKEEIKTGKLQVIIAGTFSMQSGVTLLKSALTKVVNSYATEMGGAPDGKLVIMGSVAPLMGGGETFEKSISLMFNEPPDMFNKGQWAYLLSHEVFHLWNGQSIIPLNQSLVEWFVEGFTDYMSILTAFRTGLITETEFFQKLTISYNDYLNSAGKISLLEAGADKGLNYGLIYHGGMSIAIALDVECRRSTKNMNGFVEIMRKMYSKFGITHKPYTYKDIINVSSEVAGNDLSNFFSKYVAGVEVIPIEQYLGYEGLEINQKGGETVIMPNPNASQQEKELLEAVLYE